MSENTDVIEQTQISPEGNPVYEWAGDDGHIVAIPDNGELFIPAVMSGDEVGLERLVSSVVRELEQNSLCFSNVINDELKECLNGFTEEQEYAPVYDEHVTVLRGEWSLDTNTE